MRKIATSLLLAVAVLGATAGTAAADSPEAVFGRTAVDVTMRSTCTTPSLAGVKNQFGAWGDFVDGCTTKPAWCTVSKTCTVTTQTHFAAYGRPFVNVTHNARARVFSNRKMSKLIWQQDASCSGEMACNTTAVTTTIKRGQAATVQCNGVKQHVYGEPGPMAANTCAVTVTRNL
jgi:hypothetical protein